MAALLGYFALAVLVTYPAIVQFTTNVPGDLLADRDQNLWNLWWLREAIAGTTNPYHTGMLYYPYGVDLYYHTLGLPLGLIGLLPQLLFGLPAAYNTVLLAAFTLSGYGAFRLALRFIPPGEAGRQNTPLASYFPAFAGGVVCAFTPYTLDALKGQLEVLSLQWMPFYAEAWIVAWRTGKLRYGVLSGVFFALAALSSLYYAVYLAIFSLAYLGYQLWTRRVGRGRAGLLPALAVAPVVALALMLPLLMGLVRDRNNPRLAVAAGPEHRLAHSADLLSFIAPPHDHVLLGWQPTDRPGVNEPPIHDYLALGYAAMALAILGGVVGWRRSGGKFWVALALLALVLSMGPELQVGRNLTGIPLPFRLLEWLPGVEAIAKPERLVVLARLCMGVLAASGAGWLLARLTQPGQPGVRRTAVICSAILALLLVELPIHPRYVEPLNIPSGFRALAGQSGALMELPFATQQSETGGERMLYQTAHRLPIMGGYLARTYNSPITDSCGPFWSFISARYLPIEAPDIVSPTMTSRPLDILTYFNIGYIALYNNYNGPGTTPLDPQERAAFEDILSRVSGEPPLYTDDYVSLHKVDTHPRESIQPALMVSDGWYDSEESGGEPFRWVRGEQGRLCVFTPEQKTMSLAMDATAFSRDQEIRVQRVLRELKGTDHDKRIIGPVTEYEGTISIAGTEVRTRPIVFPAGMTEVRIVPQGEGVTPQSLDPNAKDDRALTIGLKRVRLEPAAPK
ncbi:MAG TPA: hypothetical protein VF826_18450 [Chloroflexia bacterium]|jgi:hypothetical protein